MVLLVVKSFQNGGVYQLEHLKQSLERTERIFRDESAQNRKELGETLKGFGDSLQQILERVRESVEKRLSSIQQDNNLKLEKMRETVDEKLHSTLEKRLGESFRLVDEQLSKVHKDLGEMRNLAAGVGDLKKVLTNVKTRGTWGEVQLGNLLEQILTSEQYEKNVVTKKGSRDPVEFAIVFPGKDGEIVRLPIDAKFPIEDYQRLQDAQEIGDKIMFEDAMKALEQRIKFEAKKIQEKYIDPPNTTDFAVMFLPVEGLYAEVVCRPGLCDFVQREYRISVAGPNNIVAFLNSLQMGFRTLAVEKRASEVWQLLGAVKNEFGKFGDILEKTHKKLQEASNSIETASRKSRTIERKLNKVQELPSSGSQELLEEEAFDVEAE
ncbi:MAG: DNA recombination protein RmuC [Candidatus Omnitrophota bacterium]